MENSPLAVVEWDSGHHVTKWTGNATQIFGWTSSEVLGKRVDQWPFVHRDDWVKVQDAMMATERGETSISPNRNYRKDGTIVYCEWYNSVLLDADGVFAGGLSLVLDVSERHRMEVAVRASEEKYRQIFDLAPVGIFRSTADGRLLSVNAKAASLFQYETPEAMVAASYNIAEQLFVEPSQRHTMLEEALATGAYVSGEVHYLRSDGTTFLANLYLRTMREMVGGTLCVEGFVEDITERRRAEESLREAYDAMEQRVKERTAELSAANERLQELDRLKSQFLASMSHELRTPLNSIVGFTSLLRQGLTGPINPEQKKQLEIVQSSAKHLLELINDLLDVSRIEAGKPDLECKPFDFADVLQEALRSLAPVADRKGLQVIAHTGTTVISMIGDRKRALQVLLNLVNNALKFTEKGSVTIRVCVEEEVLRVDVSDTGIGIKPQHIDMLFEAFQQVDGTAKRINEGTGLGLYLCRKLLTMIGGTIQVESVYGVGSCFTYTMPLNLREASA